MANNVRHVFIAAPVETVRSKWEAFLEEQQGAHREDLGVEVIPAEGGCFLATAAPTRHRRWRFFCRPLGRRARLAMDELEAFGLLFAQAESEEAAAG